MAVEQDKEFCSMGAESNDPACPCSQTYSHALARLVSKNSRLLILKYTRVVGCRR